MNFVHKSAAAAGISETSSRERNNEFYVRMTGGDKDAINEMIEANMAIVMVRVDAFLANCPNYGYLREDLVSEGLLALTEAVQAMSKSKKDVSKINPTGYLYVAVSRAIGAAAEAEETMQLKPKTLRDAKERAQGQGVELTIPTQIPMGRNLPDVAYDETGVSELRDEIWSCAEDDQERRILKLREDGYVDDEIAEELSIPRWLVQEIRSSLYDRFLEKSGMVRK